MFVLRSKTKYCFGKINILPYYMQMQKIWIATPTINRQYGFSIINNKILYENKPSLISFWMRNFAKKGKKALKQEEIEAEKDEQRKKFQNTDLEQLLKQWKTDFAECTEEFKEELKEIKGHRASSSMFDGVVVQAYGGKHKLPDLGQTIVRGENNVVISVYDETVKESVMKAIVVHDPELEVSIEGKYISVKMGKSKAENRDAIIAQAKERLSKFKEHLHEKRVQATHTLKEIESIAPKEDVIIYKGLMEDWLKEQQKLAQELFDKKSNEIKHSK